MKTLFQKILPLLAFFIATSYLAWQSTNLAQNGATDMWAVFAVESALAPAGKSAPDANVVTPAIATLCGPDVRRFWQRWIMSSDVACASEKNPPANWPDITPWTLAAEARVTALSQRIDAVQNMPTAALVGQANAALAKYRNIAFVHPLCRWTPQWRACAAHSQTKEVTEDQVDIARQRVLQPLQGRVKQYKNMLAGIAVNRATGDNKARWEAIQKFALASSGLTFSYRYRIGDDQFFPKLDNKTRGLVSEIGDLETNARNATEAAQAYGQLSTVITWGAVVTLLVAFVFGINLWPVVLLAATMQVAALTHVANGIGSFGLRHLELRFAHEALPGYGVEISSSFVLLVALLLALPVMLPVFDPVSRGWLAFKNAKSAGVRAGILLVIGLALTVASILPALRAELYILLGCLALATFAARNVAYMESYKEPHALGWPLIIGGGFGMMLLAIGRNDMGATLLAAALIWQWTLLCMGSRIALFCGVVITLLLGVWLYMIPPFSIQKTSDASPTSVTMDTNAAPGAMPAALATPLHILPHHGEQRFAMSWAPFFEGPSDIARAIWIAMSGRAKAWGLVDYPAEGLMAGRPADRLLAQLPMDYFPCLLFAVWSWSALLILALHFFLFAWVGTKAFAASTRTGLRDVDLLIGFIGGFGCIAVAVRTALTTAGSLGTVLPLSGMPSPLLSYGNNAAFFAMLYLAMALYAGRTKRSPKEQITTHYPNTTSGIN